MKKSILTLLSLSTILISKSQEFDWAVNFGGTGNDQLLCSTTDLNGNIYSAGIFSGSADMDPGSGTFNLNESGSADIFISKIDASGNFVWAKQLSSPGLDESWDITTDDAGDIFITGHFQGSVDFDPSSAGSHILVSNGSIDIFVLKLDTDGNFIWAKSFGGTDFDFSETIDVDADGNIILSGLLTNGPVDLDPGVGDFSVAAFYDSFILKLDDSGDFVWAKLFTGADIVQVIDVCTDELGNIYSTGRLKATADFDPNAGTTSLTSNGNNDVFIAKLNSSGDLVWAKSFGSTGSDLGNTISLDASNNIVVGGKFELTVDFDPNAGTANLTSDGGIDGFVAKFDNTGNYVWSKKFGGTSDDEVISLQVKSNGSIYFTGTFETVADFDPGSSTAFLTTAGGKDIFICKLNSLGDYNWVYQFGGSGNDVGNDISIDGNGNILSTGWFEGTADFDPTTSNLSLTSAGLNDAFIVRLENTGVGINSVNSFSISLYPNPATNAIIIDCESSFERISIYSTNGQLILTSTENSIDISDFPAGLYYVVVNSQNGIAQTKFVKQ